MDPHQSASLARYLVPLLVIGLVLLRLIRNAPKRVKASRLYVLPSLLAIGVGFTLAQSGFPPVVWLLGYVLAAVLGGGVGYLTARHREFTLDQETGEISSRATPIGTIIFAVLFIARFALRLVFPDWNGGSSPESSGIPHGPGNANLMGWTDAGLVFSTAMVLGSSITTWAHVRPLMAQRKSAARLTENAEKS